MSTVSPGKPQSMARPSSVEQPAEAEISLPENSHPVAAGTAKSSSVLAVKMNDKDFQTVSLLSLPNMFILPLHFFGVRSV